MKLNRKLPSEAWGCINIDGKDCQGRFIRQLEPVLASGRERDKLICYITLPKCQCPSCRVFCGSEVNPYDGSLYEVTHKGESTDPECVKWYVTLTCDECG